MTVKISVVLKAGTEKPLQNCSMVRQVRRTRSTGVGNTLASETLEEAGLYSREVESGHYTVTRLVVDFQSSHAGTLTSYAG
ncbi:prophage tail fiber N-terminal domain-containing protein, partial [Escherichia coli]|nr:prophage tail fiber N-terminal domain-containing protein [Escherichia coli]